MKHALRYHDTDILPFPFEFAAIEHDWARISGFLQDANVLDWAVRPNRALLAPKFKYGFRIVTQLDPLDFLVFAALIHEISDDVELQRVPVARGVVYSYRVDKADDGQLFNGDIGFEDFRRHASEMLEDENYSHVSTWMKRC